MRVFVHKPSACVGEICAIHNPSHHMAHLRWTIRLDRSCLIERHCSHGAGHPDPDSVRWLEAHGIDVGHGMHGCCEYRCCIPEETSLKEIIMKEISNPYHQSPAPTHYRGVPVPGQLLRYWDKPTGRWWRAGVDDKGDRMPVEVLPGQTYQDNDYRKPGRTLRVDRISSDGLYAVCTVLTNYDRVQAALDNEWTIYKDMRGTETEIKVRRLYPNARGYALISEWEAQAA